MAFLQDCECPEFADLIDKICDFAFTSKFSDHINEQTNLINKPVEEIINKPSDNINK